MKKIEPGVLKLNIADRPQDFYSKIAGSRAAVIFLALVGIFAGVFVFILPCLHITYDKTEARTVNYVNFEAEQSRSFEGKMRFSDGTDGNVYVRDGAEDRAPLDELAPAVKLDRRSEHRHKDLRRDAHTQTEKVL